VATAPRNPEAATAVHDAFRTGAAWSLGSWVALRVAGSTLVVPVCEELAFRGFLLRWLVRREFSAVPFDALRSERSTKRVLLAILGSSIAFGVLHDRWIAGLFAGLVYALIAIRRGHLGAAIIAHAATNAVIAVWVLSTSDYSQWISR
jgi:CAAX prenyl protease-like protein